MQLTCQLLLAAKGLCTCRYHIQRHSLPNLADVGMHAFRGAPGPAAPVSCSYLPPTVCCYCSTKPLQTQSCTDDLVVHACKQGSRWFLTMGTSCVLATALEPGRLHCAIAMDQQLH